MDSGESTLVTDLELATLHLISQSDVQRIKLLASLPGERSARRVFLDLGCGVPGGKEHSVPGGEQCRVFFDQGWDVVGVDRGAWTENLPGWCFVQGDITRQATWDDLPAARFDLVSSRFLVSMNPREISPSLLLANGFSPYAELTGDVLQSEEYLQFLRFFFSNIFRVLKPSGLLALNDRHLLVKETRAFAPYDTNRFSNLSSLLQRLGAL